VVSLANTSRQYIVDAGEAKGEEDVAAHVEVSTMPPITPITTAKTTPSQVKPKHGAQTFRQTRLQPGEVEEVMSPISDINNLRELTQTTKA
jgi:hypothetical protein